MTRLVLAWGTVALAVAAAVVAVLSLLGGSLSARGHVMSQEEVRAALALASPRTSTAAAVPSTRSSVRRLVVLNTEGGTVVASCAGGLVTLRSWSPAQGYSIDEAEPGPATVAKVEFDGDDREDAEARVGCSGGRPVMLSSD